MNYRKLWENTYGKIPKDEKGRSFEIHHIDGNRKNNKIDNLKCVSIEEHYEIHIRQFIDTGNYKDLSAAKFLAGKLNKNASELKGYKLPEKTKKKIREKLKGVKHSKERVEKMKKKLKGYKWSDKDIESRKNGLLQYYKNASEEELKKRWNKISKSHKGKVLKEETKEKLSRHNAKLTDNEVLEIVKMIEDGVKYKVISETYNISQSQITSIKQKKTYKWLWK